MLKPPQKHMRRISRACWYCSEEVDVSRWFDFDGTEDAKFGLREA